MQAPFLILAFAHSYFIVSRSFAADVESIGDTGTFPEQQRALVVDFSATFASLWTCQRIAADFQDRPENSRTKQRLQTAKSAATLARAVQHLTSPALAPQVLPNVFQHTRWLSRKPANTSTTNSASARVMGVDIEAAAPCGNMMPFSTKKSASCFMSLDALGEG